MILTPEIRERLKTVMVSKHVTGYTIKEKLGISATTVGNYINANSKIQKADTIKIAAICKLLGITPEWLEYGDDVAKSPEEESEEANLSSEEFMLKNMEEIKSKMNVLQEQYTVIRKDAVATNRRLEEITNLLSLIQTSLQELNKN